MAAFAERGDVFFACVHDQRFAVRKDSILAVSALRVDGVDQDDAVVAAVFVFAFGERFVGEEVQERDFVVLDEQAADDVFAAAVYQERRRVGENVRDEFGRQDEVVLRGRHEHDVDLVHDSSPRLFSRCSRVWMRTSSLYGLPR